MGRFLAKVTQVRSRARLGIQVSRALSSPERHKQLKGKTMDRTPLVCQDKVGPEMAEVTSYPSCT